MIELINCKSKLEVLGIYMEEIGSGAIFTSKLEEKIMYLSWEYNFTDDKIIIWVDEETIIPNLSEFGEVVKDGIPTG